MSYSDLTKTDATNKTRRMVALLEALEDFSKGIEAATKMIPDGSYAEAYFFGQKDCIDSVLKKITEILNTD